MASCFHSVLTENEYCCGFNVKFFYEKFVHENNFKMKYNTISGGSLTSETKKATLTIYADMDISQNKVTHY